MPVDFQTLQRFFHYDADSSYAFLQLGDDYFKMRIPKISDRHFVSPDLNDKGVPNSPVSYEKVIGCNYLPILEEIDRDSDLHRKLDKWIFQNGLLNVQEDQPVPSALKSLSDVMNFYEADDWEEAGKIYDRMLEDSDYSLEDSFDE